MDVTKISTQLINQMNTIANHDLIPIIVRHRKGLFSEAVSFSLATDVISQMSDKIEAKFKLFSAKVLKATAGEIEALSKKSGVQQIWPDLPVQHWLNTSVPKINAPKVWRTMGFKGQGIKIAVLDTGIDETHLDFAGRIVATKSFIGPTAHDDNGHGTHVAGTIGGSGAMSRGKYVGVAPLARLYIGKVLRANGGGKMSSVMAGIEWAVLEQKVQIINLSLGGVGPCDGTDALSTLCDEAVLQGNVVMCVAAGNMGPTLQTIGTPGCARFVITVGAIDDNDRVAYFSSRGPSADGRIKPDIVFPGVQIIAPRATGTNFGRVMELGYASSDGTSMATPHASGVAALMLQANPKLSAFQVKTRMIAGGINIGALPSEQGIGRGDAYRAVKGVSREELSYQEGKYLPRVTRIFTDFLKYLKF